ncbi:RNA methyltransferase [Hydrogenophilus islandicus]
MADNAERITSRANPRVKRWREWMTKSSVRRAARWVLLEGAHLVEAAVAARWPLVDVWVDSGGEARFQPLLAQVAALGIPVTRVTTEVLAAVTETTTPQGIVAEVIPPEPQLQPWGDCDLVIADGIQDPGNVGALLRVAAAAGVRAVWLAPGSAHAWSPKVLRAAMGAHMVVAIFEGEVPDAVWQPYAAQERLIATSLDRGSRSFYTLDLRRPVAWIMGNEGAGVRPVWFERGALSAHLPLAPGVESLNVATAAAVFLFEAERQRRLGSC